MRSCLGEKSYTRAIGDEHCNFEPRSMGDRLTNTFTKDFCVFGQRTHTRRCDQVYTLETMYEILTTARDLELEVNEDDIKEFIMGHEDELTTEELQEILNEEHQETTKCVSF
ncbi:hypothetical protein TNCV_548901 [Trichonephila clavipes]|nr:hypothetical protein TNCV_548901 [Trichonephila clavipes]